jgi:hypothetical protein
MDLLFMLLTLCFFALTWGLVVVCERISESQP